MQGWVVVMTKPNCEAIAVENLTQVVKETLAIGFVANQTKTFTTLDLWNIHRQRKNLAYRR